MNKVSGRASPLSLRVAVTKSRCDNHDGRLRRACNRSKECTPHLGLVSASNPQLPVLDILSKYSHDSDLAIALNAIFALGLVGAGTNNARLPQMFATIRGLLP